MGNSKKAKIITRVIAGLLVVVMALGFIIPYVSASEIEEPEADVEATVEQEVEETPAATEAPATKTNDDEVPGYLPTGLHYEKSNGKWIVAVNSDADVVPLQPTGMPQTSICKAEEITIFVANLKTKEVQTVALKQYYDYIGTIKFEPGYYVAYSNGIGWGVDDDYYMTLNDGSYVYFRIGSSTVAEVGGITFTDASAGLLLNMTQAPDAYNLVQPGQTILITNDMKAFPSNFDELSEIMNNGEDKAPTQEKDDKEEIPEDEKEENKTSIGKLFLNMLKRSIGILVIIAGCFIGTIIIKRKREATFQKRVESDRYDDTRIR